MSLLPTLKRYCDAGNTVAKSNVLVTASGSIVSQGIIKSLKLANKRSQNGSRISYTIVSTDASPLAAGLYRCDKGEIVPRASSPDYIDSIIRVCKDNDIDAVFVGSDDELLVLADARPRIKSESGALVFAATDEILSIGRDKWKTFEFCTDNHIKCAPSALPENLDLFVKEYGFPVVVKPREGYGSVQFHISHSVEQANDAINNICSVGWRPLIQKFIEGEEYTSGVTVDAKGTYVMSSISIQKFLKHGQTHKAFIDDFPDVRKSAEATALKLGIRGPVNVQVRMDGEQPALIEINPRFSATCPMRAIAGVNEPDIVFRNSILGEEIKVDHYEQLVCLRYWNEVYLSKKLFRDVSKDGHFSSNDDPFIPDYF